MLRSHVQQSNAAVGCEGFDADAASAYLENALLTCGRAEYESHLAVCHPCRQQLTQLALLFDTEQFPQVAAKPLAWWERLRQRVNVQFGEWQGAFDLRWNWQAAAWAGGALATVLVALLSTQMFRSSSEATRLAMVTPTPLNQFIVSAESSPESTSQDVSSSDFGGLSALGSQVMHTASIPKPEVTPNLKSTLEFAPDQLRVSPTTSLLSATQPVAAPSVAAPNNAVEAQLPTGLSGNTAQALVVSQVNAQDALRAGGGVTQLNLAEDEVGKSEIGSRISLSPNDNPMRTAGLKTAARRKESIQPERPVWRDRVMGFMPYNKEERERLEKLPVEEDALKAMKIRIRDRVFYFANGTWIDNEYKPEMAWRVTKLVRDSAEYERVLAEEPGLKAYFVKGAITVIWRDKIYKVVSK